MSASGMAIFANFLNCGTTAMATCSFLLLLLLFLCSYLYKNNHNPSPAAS